MKVSVASGKGGTGKTTVATNLAAAQNREILFLDCDVEEPNAHLFLKPTITSEATYSTMLPEIDHNECDLCRKCMEICRYNALTVVGGQVLLFPQLCHSCQGCMVVCPKQCISPGKKELGTLHSGTAGHIVFHYGLLKIGEAMAPPLIKRLRQEENEMEHTIIDAPPGTSCPVIAAMDGADFVLLVTEATPFGLHDLKLAHQTVLEMGIPCGLVINRADMGDRKVHDYAARHELPILLEIPFSKTIAGCYSRGELLIHERSEWKRMFFNLFSAIVSLTLPAGRAS